MIPGDAPRRLVSDPYGHRPIAPDGYQPRHRAGADDSLDDWTPIIAPEATPRVATPPAKHERRFEDELDGWVPVTPLTVQPGRHSVRELAAPARTRPAFTRRRALVAAIVVVVLLVVFQVAWPSGRMLPHERIDGVDVGGLALAQAGTAVTAAYMSQPVHLVDAAGEPLMNLTLPTGALSARAPATQYPLWQRLIPGSLLWRAEVGVGTSVHPMLAQAQLPDLSHAPVNAAVVVAGDTLQVMPAQLGFQADDPHLLAKINATVLSPAHAATVEVAGTTTQPQISTAAAATLRDTIMGNLAHGLTFTTNGQSKTLDATSVLSMLSFTPTGPTLTAAVDAAGLRATLSSWTARTTASGTQDAVSIDWAATAKAATSALTGGGGPVGVSLEVASSADPSLSYPDTFEGLRQELAARFGNRPYAVSVIGLTGQHQRFSVNGAEVFTSASTYKIFVAYAMTNAVEQGQLTWNSPLNGTTLQDCFQKMIVDSDNDCPQAWLDTYGYQTLTDQAHAIGAEHTTFAESDMQTTADDLAQTLAKLYDGELMDSTDQATMIAAMENQVYRSGIPAGLAGQATVADKVGFLDALLHDAGIVYSPKGNFVLVVMTDDCTWGDIAATASAVYARM